MGVNIINLNASLWQSINYLSTSVPSQYLRFSIYSDKLGVFHDRINIDGKYHSLK